MYGTSVSTTSYINIVTVHVTNYAANITYNKFFCLILITGSDNFRYKTITVTCAGSHNVAAVINAPINSIFNIIVNITIAKITGNAAYIMCAAHFVFFVSCVGNISINSTANNAANITCIIIIITSLFTTAYVTAVSYIFNFTFFINSAISLNRIICFTGNTANISNINIYLGNMCSSISRMIVIFSSHKPCCRYVAAVFGVLYGSTFHIADNAADIVSPGYVHTIVNKVSAVANGGIYSVANQTTDVSLCSRYVAEVVAIAI